MTQQQEGPAQPPTPTPSLAHRLKDFLWLGRTDRWTSLAAYGLLLLWALPLIAVPNTRGAVESDWEYFLSYWEAIRQSLLTYHQFPGYNPWNALGSPLWANPQVGPLSHYLPLVLTFGTLYGVKLGIALGNVIAFFTARALGQELFGRRAAAVIAALLYALNPALLAHLARGHLSFGAYAIAPLLILSCLRLARSRWAGLQAGVVARPCCAS